MDFPAMSIPVAPDRAGVALAFDVIDHHTVHTRGYVMTAIQLIEEYGTEVDKERLRELLDRKRKSVTADSVASSTGNGEK